MRRSAPAGPGWGCGRGGRCVEAASASWLEGHSTPEQTSAPAKKEKEEEGLDTAPDLIFNFNSKLKRLGPLSCCKLKLWTSDDCFS